MQGPQFQTVLILKPDTGSRRWMNAHEATKNGLFLTKHRLFDYRSWMAANEATKYRLFGSKELDDCQIKLIS